MPTSLISSAIARRATVFVVFAFLLLFGGYSYHAIPKESAPDIPLPIFMVNVQHEGISPEDAVRLLVKPIEKEVRSVEGLDEINSVGYQGGANITLKFLAGTDNKKALNDVRAKVDMADAKLPEDALEPTITELNMSTFPVLTVVLRGDLPERALKHLAEDLRDEVEAVPGVLKAEVNGVREEQVLVEVDKAKLESYAITPAQFFKVIQANNQLVAAGALEGKSGKFPVKVPGLFRTADDLLNLPLVSEGDRTVRVSDVAEIKPTFKDPTTLARVNGERAVTLEVSKRIGENVITTLDAVKEAVAQSSKRWPQGVSYSFTGDESRKIRTMVADLENGVLFSVLLVMMTVLAALGPRSAALVAVSVPGSFLTAMLLLYAFGYTSNVVVLFSLILSVGMLVDGAVIVTEYAERTMAEGEPPPVAFAKAASYMAWPVFASTATVIAAFLPLLFWPGLTGHFMRFLPLTIVFVLSASYVMAMLFVPVIGSKFGKPNKEAAHEDNFFERLSQKYVRVMHVLLPHSGKVLLASVALFFVSVGAYAVLGKGVEFFPNVEPERANILIHAQGDYGFQEKDAIMQEVGKRLANLKGVDTVYVKTGSGGGGGGSTRGGGGLGGGEDVVGSVFLELTEWENRTEKANDILQEAQNRLKDMSGTWAELEKEKKGPSQGKPIQLAVSGDDLQTVYKTAAALRAEIEKIPGVKNVDDTRPKTGLEWNMVIDRQKAALMGTNLSEAGLMLRLATSGAKVGAYRPDTTEDEVDIMARLKPEQRTLSTLDDMRVETSEGTVPLSHFTTRESGHKVTAISRLDRKNVVMVQADVKDGVLPAGIIEGIKQELAKRELPAGVKVTFKGQDKDQKESQAFLGKAFLVAILLIAGIMMAEFNSLYQTFVVLSAVVLSTAGVLAGHIVMGMPFGVVMSGLGIIALAGVIVHNNIVLLDTYNKLRPTMPWQEALIETGRLRLRPVLLTAITAAIGLLPMGLKLTIDIFKRHITYNAPSSQMWDQLANSIMFGLVFATVLTLVVTPCMMALAERRKG